VVSEPVLGEEVLVEHAAEQQAPEPLLPGLAAMDELMGGDDREARARAHHEEDHHHVHGEEPLDREEPDQLEDDQELETREGVDQ